MTSPHPALVVARCARGGDDRPGTPTRRHRDEDGSVTPLIIGFLLILLTLVAVVVDASSAYLKRQGLANLADSAALAATEGLEGEQVYTQGLGDKAQIDPATARGYVQQYLSASGARSRYPGLQVRVVTEDDTVRVRLAARIDLPLRVPGVAGSTRVTADAASQVLVGD